MVKSTKNPQKTRQSKTSLNGKVPSRQQAKPDSKQQAKPDGKQISMFTVALNEQPHKIGDYLDTWLCLLTVRTVETRFGTGVVATVIDETGNKFDVWLSSILARDLSRFKPPVLFCPTQKGNAYVLSDEQPPDDVVAYFEVWVNNSPI